jgi:thiamine phosphate synthase YjbQ (UPF0047 family)
MSVDTKTLKKYEIQNGAVVVFVVGSTAGITTIEYEPGVQKDFYGEILIIYQFLLYCLNVGIEFLN